MAKLATELPKQDFGQKPHVGPRGVCYPLYGDCDIEDLEAVNQLREQGLTWEQLQEQIDKILEIENPIPRERFIYHWRKQCACWRGKEGSAQR